MSTLFSTPLADSKAHVSFFAGLSCSRSGKESGGQEMKGVPPPPLTGPQPAPLVQQAGTCVFSPSLAWEPTPPALTSRSHGVPLGGWAVRAPSRAQPSRPQPSRPGETQSLLKVPWEEVGHPHLPPSGAPSLHSALTFLPKAQEEAQRALGKLCDSGSEPASPSSGSSGEAQLPSDVCSRGRHSH